MSSLRNSLIFKIALVNEKEAHIRHAKQARVIVI